MKQIYFYNHLVRTFYRTKNKLQKLFAEKKDTRKQDILFRRLHKLLIKITSLQYLAKKGIVAGAVTAGIFFHTNAAKAQITFVPSPVFNPFGLDSITILDWGSASPVFVDLDADGDMDMFSGSNFDHFAYFENLGTSAVPVYNNRITNPFSLPSWCIGIPAFTDIDADGDMDLFAGTTEGEFFYFENTGSPASPAFALPVSNPFSIGDAGTEAKPVFGDLDADGDFDLLSGNFLGEFLYYENTGTDASPDFAPPVLNPFSLPDLGYRTRPALGDMDADGDLDIFCQYSGDETPLFYFENTGTVSSPEFTFIGENPFNLQFGTYPAVADLDHDGDLDLMTSGFTYFQNYGTAESPDFRTLGLAVADQNSTPDLVDIDNDGDYDIVSGNRGGEFDFFQNMGSAEIPVFQYIEDISPFAELSAGVGVIDLYSTAKFSDLDNDGDFDFLSGDDQDNFYYFENTGTAESPLMGDGLGLKNPFSLSGGNERQTPAFADLDNDGDFDIMSGNEYGDFEFYRNTGTPESPLFDLFVMDTFSLTEIGTYSLPAFADLDSDGDMDMMSGEDDGNFFYSENVGSGEHALFDTWQKNPFNLRKTPWSSAPAIADLDNDGDLDMLSGSGDGYLYYFENTNYSTAIYYRDADGDGFGDPGVQTMVINAPIPDGFTVDSTDCDDAIATVNPAETEVCNGLDDNCSGFIDEGFPTLDYYTDADGDGYGDEDAAAINFCMLLTGTVTNHTDCNDANNSIYPGAAEICNHLDENCSGTDDEGLIYLDYYADADEDEYGDILATAVSACAPVGGAVTDNTDCNDADETIHPGVTETCNGIDDNCTDGIDDGLPFTDFYPDADLDHYGDKYAAPVSACAPIGTDVINNADCDDTNPAINPIAAEVDNSIDDDCDGSVDEGFVAIQNINTADGNQFFIYPNPAKDQVIIVCNYTNKNSSIASIKITDATGRTVLETSGEMINGTMEKTIPFSKEFEAGIYYVALQSAEHLQVKPLIIIK